MRYLFVAISFLTIAPITLKGGVKSGDLGRSGIWFPLVGFLIGACVFAIGKGLENLFSPLLSSVILLIFWVGLTGGLHLDGLADCCDGLLHPSTKERRLEIMKDPRMGAFGVIGLILFLLLKTALMHELLLNQNFLPFLLAPAMGRWFILISAKQPLAKVSGMGADFAQGINRKVIFVSGILPIALGISMGIGGILAIILAAILVAGIHWFSRSRIGGVTGDIFGLVVELVEMMVLLSSLMF